jgi:hypothetical protein
MPCHAIPHTLTSTPCYAILCHATPLPTAIQVKGEREKKPCMVIHTPRSPQRVLLPYTRPHPCARRLTAFSHSQYINRPNALSCDSDLPFTSRSPPPTQYNLLAATIKQLTLLPLLLYYHYSTTTTAQCSSLSWPRICSQQQNQQTITTITTNMPAQRPSHLPPCPGPPPSRPLPPLPKRG